MASESRIASGAGTRGKLTRHLSKLTLCSHRLHRAAVFLALAVALPAAGHAQIVTATLAAGTNPRSVAVNPVTNKIYVANQNSASVTVIDGASNTERTVAAGTNPYAVAVNP